MPFLPKSVLFLLLPMAVLTSHAQQQKTDTLTLHFDFDSSVVRGGDSNLFSRIAGLPIDSILIIGHTDTRGSIAYNQRLSMRRAVSTEAALGNAITVATNIPARLEGHGKTEPLPGDDSLSRRAVVIVYYHQKEPPPVAHTDTPPPHPPGEPDTVIALNNINFIANTPILTDAAREALPGSVDYLRSFSDRYLEIDGFCNQPGPPLPPKDPLFILSVNRAKFIYDYLIEQGFDSTHLRYKGLGNTKPVNAHPTTVHEMDQNMRVEIKVFKTRPL